jgi:serine protease Do
MGRLAVVGLMLAGLAACAGFRRPAQQSSFIPTEKLREAVVYVQGCGTGWMVTDQFVVTNRHVSDCVREHFSGRAQVIFSRGFHVMGEVYSTATGRYVDLALIRLDGIVSTSRLMVARDDRLTQRDIVLSIGNPQPGRWVPTSYRVISKPRYVPGGLNGVIVMEGYAVHGDSGSPVVTLDGRVVGVLFARSRGHAYAVPVRPYLMELLQEIPRPNSQFSNKNHYYSFW